MMQNLFLKIETINKKLYFQMLFCAVVVYYAAARIFQDIFYRGKFTEYVSDAFSGFVPHPEPLEIPLYVAGFVLIPILALILYWLQNKGILKYLVGTVAIVALWKIWPRLASLDVPSPQIVVDYLQTKGIGKAFWLIFTKRTYVLRVGVGLSAIFFLVVYFFWKPYWVNFFAKWKDARALKTATPWFLIFLGLLIFHPNFPYDEHHYNFMIGTVNDTLHGKTLFYETSNQYGILNVYFLKLIFQTIGKLSYEAFSAILFATYYLYYVALYYFIRKWLGSRLLAYLGVGIIVAITYFLQISPTLSAYDFPNFSPFRSGFYIFILLSICAFWKTKNWKYRELAVFAAALAPFWNFDTGTYALVACFFSLAIYSWFEENLTFSPTKKLAKLVVLAGKFAGYAFLVFLAITLGNYFTYGKLPNWSGYLYTALLYGQGVAQNPLPLFGIFEVFIFIYLAALLRNLWRIAKGRSVNLPLMFLLAYGPMSFIYFIGNSAWNLIYSVSVPLILICLYYAYHYLEKRVVFALFATLLFFSLFVYAVKIPVELSNRDYGKIGSSAGSKFSDPQLDLDAKLLAERYGFLERIPILHESGTKLLLTLGKINYFDFYDIFQLYRRRDMHEVVVKKIREGKPEYIFVDKVKNDQIEYVETMALTDYEISETLNTMYVYQRKSK